MNKLDLDYQNLLKDILENGIKKEDRTGTGTLSIFGRQIRHKMSDGFPLLTTKKMFMKGIVTELLWFLRGDTNIKFLLDNDCHIWDGDAYKKYLSTGDDCEIKWLFNKAGHEPCPVDGPFYRHLTKEEFIERIQNDSEFCKKWGDLGPVYGKQWRNWCGYEKIPDGWEHGAVTHYKEVPKCDQILELIQQLKTNPDSRRLMVNAWNVAEINQMTLPPCHYGFQLYTRELSEQERWFEYVKKCNHLKTPEIIGSTNKEVMESYYKKFNTPTRAISLMWNQRSVDTFLGLPFNVASYGLLLEIIAKEVNMVPEELIGNLGDTHLYSNHIEQAKEQIGREPYLLPKLILHDWYSTQGSRLNSSEEISHFLKSIYLHNIEIKDYKSHSIIKAPLSN